MGNTVSFTKKPKRRQKKENRNEKRNNSMDKSK